MSSTRATRLDPIVDELSRKVAELWLEGMDLLPEAIESEPLFQAFYSEFDPETEVDDALRAIEVVLDASHLALVEELMRRHHRAYVERVYGDF